MTLQKKIYIIVFLSFISSASCQNNTNQLPFVLLQAFGSTQQTGRSVAGNTERGVTLQLAEHISAALNEGPEGIEAFIINPAGRNKNSLIETFNKINHLHNAVVVRLTASQCTTPKPSCSIFYRCYNPLTDQIKRPMAPLTPIPLEDVYLASFNASKTLAKTLSSQAIATPQNVFDIKPPAGIPLAAVRGIRHPVIQIEIQIDQQTHIMHIGDLLTRCIKQTITP